MVREEDIKELIQLVDSSDGFEKAKGIISKMSKLERREALDRILVEAYNGLELYQACSTERTLSMGELYALEQISKSVQARIKNETERKLIEEDAETSANRQNAEIIKIA